MDNAPPLDRIVADYAPLVKATASRYQGRGAEYEDLVQEGYLALITLAPKCSDARWLPAFLKNRLPGVVRDAAARIRSRRAEGGILLEALEETAGEDEEAYSEAEIRETLPRSLTADELDMTQALLEGFTQSELAEILGISQQAVAARLKKIRAKLRKVLAAAG